VTARSSSAPTTRTGKASFVHTFTLTRTLALSAPSLDGTQVIAWKIGWQICQIDGVCLLPGEKTVAVRVPVASPAFDAGGFWEALFGAFVGGFLLNLMPCVFPVLALKAVGLAAAAGQTLRTRRRDAWLFAAGGVATLTGFGVLTAIVALGGQRLDWGFTFQQPAFVWFLMVAFWAFALQLWGLWSWSGSPFRLLGPASGRPIHAFAGGALMVVAAAPCTAPFLGAALGFALAQPPATIPLYFFAAGVGLVLPLLILERLPGWSRWLPRPGVWMVWVERLAGVFLAGTVGYLFWIFIRQTSTTYVALGVSVLAAVAVVLGIRGRLPQSRWTGWATWLVVVGAVLVVLFPSTATTDKETPPPVGWIRYSPEALADALAAGKPVLIDATAAWCATCQVNEFAVLHRPDVTALLHQKNITLLLADYTKPDPVVRAWLASVGRAGLPVYALYRQGKPVHLFPELLTDDNFTRALPGLLTP